MGKCFHRRAHLQAPLYVCWQPVQRRRTRIARLKMEIPCQGIWRHTVLSQGKTRLRKGDVIASVRGDLARLNLEAELAVGLTGPPFDPPFGMLRDPLLGFHLASPSAVKRSPRPGLR